MAKYEVTTTEGEFEPGSNEAVLKNKLGIITVDDINEAETELLIQLYEYILSETDHSALTAVDITNWHRMWLGNLYEWAGEYRSVNMSKGGFHFAAAKQIPKLLQQFESDFLSQFECLSQLDEEAVISFLAQSHVEFILIHPYREGNGRLSRLFMDVCAVQAGFDVLDYELWDDNKEFYFKSIQAGVSGDYQHIERLVRDVLK
ncbi:Fic family protein [Marinomonas sp. A79]|uniref:Fic family protein n=1 Tax=Marinomonas vulgaris TaxID=2823372 RepID=A0ABS5HET5_9GAMM|nr:Fic family protein [Marinomonas vulgaris]MBR7890126.1 Fic family protein [Marinomonas vulgaris]